MKYLLEEIASCFAYCKRKFILKICKVDCHMEFISIVCYLILVLKILKRIFKPIRNHFSGTSQETKYARWALFCRSSVWNSWRRCTCWARSLATRCRWRRWSTFWYVSMMNAAPRRYEKRKTSPSSLTLVSRKRLSIFSISYISASIVLFDEDFGQTINTFFLLICTCIPHNCILEKCILVSCACYKNPTALF